MALVNPNIAMSFRQPEFTPRNALAEYAQIQQIQGGQRQAEVANMQLAQMRQKEKAISDIQAKAAQGGGPTDRRAIARAYIQSGDPEFMQFGLTMETTLDELDAFKNIMGTGGGSGAAAAAPAAPAAGMDLPAGAQTPGDFTSTEAMGRVPGVATSPIPDSPPMNAAMPAQANALAPAQPAPTNALANPVAALRAKRDQLIALGTPRAIQAARSMDSDIALMSRESRMYTVPGVGLVDPTGRVITPSVATPTDLQRNYEFAKTPEGGGFRGSLADFKVLSTPKSTTTVSVSTEKKYGEQLAGKIADRDDAKLGAAESAPRLAESANRIIDIVSRGDVFTGPAADIKLNIARALNIAGANNQEKIANTEQLIAGTGQSTLDAIKGAGLGTGQGFTDKDLKFLQGIAGGTINLTAQTLTELATLQHRVATRAADAWSKRSKEIPKDVLAGMGISTEPIKVPPLASVMKRGALGIPQGAIDDLKAGVGTDAQFDAQFGPGAAARARGVK